LSVLLAAAACRKPLPAEPLDVRRPPFDADIVIRALDLTTTVPGLDVELTDPDGNRHTGSTDSTGVLLFDFPDMTRGLWRAFIPEQGRYFDSEVVFEAREGVNDVTFQSNPQLVLTPLSLPVTYSYSTDTFIPLRLDYVQGGALRVPISITSSPLPSGWNVGYPVKLGREVNSGSVTIAVPAGQYQQPVFDMFGYSAGATTTYTETIYSNSSVTLKRGFPVNVFMEVSWTAYAVAGSIHWSGTYSVYGVNGAGIPWTGYVTFGVTGNEGKYGGAALAFTGNTTQNWSGSVPADGQTTYGVKFCINISSPVGTYHREVDTGICLACAHANPYRLPMVEF
jgi:hypothetical protein